MDDPEGSELDQLLRRLAEVPDAEAPSLVRPGMVLADRLQIEQQLGAGGMGRVFAAYDRVRQSRVAVKVLGRLTPRSIVQLKHEFRSVAELVHPNLVRCHELFSDGVEWFFTMDLVDGVTLPTFLERVRDDERWDALRRILRQLALALRALHDAGVLHGDLKPSNFLITKLDHRVVLMDFGLARPIGLAALPGGGGGTPGYMAPEQLAGDTLTEAVDWYAFGVVLYRALTGQRPAREGAASPRLLGAPEDLGRLCLDLLQTRPEDRPTGHDVLRRIDPAERPTAPSASAVVRPILVGREKELGALEDAFQASLSGRPSIALVLGPSGIGKTSLAAAFLDGVRERGGLVLSGSCRERESMPYKAVDGVVDGLVDVLDALPRAEATALLPRHLAELTILLPGLREAAVVMGAPAPPTEPSDRTAIRLRAIAAFGELLANLRRRAPLVVWIDDLQWSDAESALLLGPTLGGPEPVPLLFMGGCRAGAPGPRERRQPPLPSPPPAPTLEALFADRNLILPRVTETSLTPLEPEAAQRLALELLPSGEPTSTAQDIAREADGTPLFITELAHARHSGGPARQVSSTLQDLVARRVAALPREARRLLEMTAVAGAPVPRSVLRAALEITFVEGEASLDLLRVNRLARTRGLKEVDAVEVHHDRIREIVVTGLDEGHRKRCHLVLAQVLETRAEGRPDFVAAHYEAAGELEQASRHWLLAAEQAAGALAFDRAADLYAKAIRHARLEPDALRAVQLKRAEALGRAGKGPAAADVYLTEAGTCPHHEAVELRRRAAEQLLLSGHIERGLAVIEQVLRTIGMRGTRSGRRGLLSFVAGRLHVQARGLRHVPRSESELSREERAHLDAAWTVACSLGVIDYIRGADFQNEHLLLALRAGEPKRLLRALSLEASYSAIPGVGSQRRTARLLAIADELARTSADHAAIAFLSVARGVAAYLQGRLEQAVAELEGATERLARLGAEAVLGALSAQRFAIASLFFLGRLRRLGELVSSLLADAEGTGNLYATMCVRAGYSSAAWLVRDDVAEARRQLDRVREEWSVGTLQLSHVNVLLGEVYVDLYSGDAERALTRLEEQWPQIREAHLLRIAVLRAQLLQLRAASAAAAADRAEKRGQRVRAGTLRRVARADVERLRRERVVRALPWAALVDAALAWSAGEDATMQRCLADAIEGFDRQGMRLYAAAARVRLGERTGRRDGASMAKEGYGAFEREGVVRPDRMIQMLAPGFGSTA